MCTERPLSKSSTLRGCCQASSVIINGWLFPKTPLAWSSTDWQEEEGDFSSPSQFAPYPAGAE